MFAPVLPRCHRLALLGGLIWVLGGGCSTEVEANRALLETLPQERRVDLLEDLSRFDNLPTAEQTAIRRLDATLAALQPAEQARYRALIQHYHVWFQGLTEDQRTALRTATDPKERARLAQQYRGAGGNKVRRPGTRIAGLRTGSLGLPPPLEMASFLQIWQALTPERRTSLERKPWPALHDELRTEGRSLKIHAGTLPPDEEKRLDAQLEADSEFRPLIQTRKDKIDQANRNQKPEMARRAENNLRLSVQSFAQFLYYEEHPPAKAVAPERLARFAEAAPEWLHAQTDSLSGDDARAYYSLLYRLLYPASKEMPEPTAPAGTKANPAKTSAPRTGPVPQTL